MPVIHKFLQGLKTGKKADDINKWSFPFCCVFSDLGGKYYFYAYHMFRQNKSLYCGETMFTHAQFSCMTAPGLSVIINNFSLQLWFFKRNVILLNISTFVKDTLPRNHSLNVQLLSMPNLHTWYMYMVSTWIKMNI